MEKIKINIENKLEVFNDFIKKLRWESIKNVNISNIYGNLKKNIPSRDKSLEFLQIKDNNNIPRYIYFIYHMDFIND